MSKTPASKMPVPNPSKLPRDLLPWAIKQMATPEGLPRRELTQRVGGRQFQWSPLLEGHAKKPVTMGPDPQDGRCLIYRT
jgi:hypothetical protein